MNGVSLLPLEYKLKQTKKQKERQLLERTILASAVIFILLVLSSAALFATSRIVYTCNKTNQDLINQISLYGNYESVINDINTANSQVQTAIGTYPDMLRLISEVAKAVPDGVSINDIAIKYDGKEGSCIVYGKAASHSEVSSFIEKLRKINMLNEPECLYSKNGGTLSEFEITAALKNNTPQKLKEN